MKKIRYKTLYYDVSVIASNLPDDCLKIVCSYVYDDSRYENISECISNMICVISDRRYKQYKSLKLHIRVNDMKYMEIKWKPIENKNVRVAVFNVRIWSKRFQSDYCIERHLVVCENLTHFTIDPNIYNIVLKCESVTSGQQIDIDNEILRYKSSMVEYHSR